MTDSVRFPDTLLTRAVQQMRSGDYTEAVFTLRRFLHDVHSVWPDTRCDAMLLLAQCCLRQDNRAEAERWLLRACAELPRSPKPWAQAEAFYETMLPQGAAFCAARAAAQAP